MDENSPDTHRDYQLSETERMLVNLIRVGVIHKVDYQNGTAQVKFGGTETDFIPWFTLRAGKDKSWNPPNKGEQVMVLSPNGDLVQGVILVGLFSNQFPQNASKEGVHRIDYEDKSYYQHDNETQKTEFYHEGPLVIKGNILTKITSEHPVIIESNAALTLKGSSKTVVL